jgi:hypothetical protein
MENRRRFQAGEFAAGRQKEINQLVKLAVSVRLIVLGAICAALAGSIVYRAVKGKPILRPAFSDLRFADTWCYGRSDRSFLARAAGAPYLLWVAVTDDTLHVSPHFPFNLMFFAEAFGWDHRVPAKSIVDVRNSARNPAGVAVRYRHRTGDEELLELFVSNPPGLEKALQAARGS